MPLAPTVTRVVLLVSPQFVPVGGTLGLDQKFMQEDGEFQVVFDPSASPRRVTRIRSHLTSANLAVNPALEFEYEKVGDFTLRKSVLFRARATDLSPSLGGMPGGEIPSALFFDSYVVRPPPKPDATPSGGAKPSGPPAK